MFERLRNTTIEQPQNIDDDEVIEAKIKNCQRENGRCMVSTSSRLKKKYGHYKVNLVLRRLSARRYRGNKYQEKGMNEIVDMVKGLAEIKNSPRSQSSNFMSL
jgi:hypothetical protein